MRKQEEQDLALNHNMWVTSGTKQREMKEHIYSEKDGKMCA